MRQGGVALKRSPSPLRSMVEKPLTFSSLGDTAWLAHDRMFFDKWSQYDLVTPDGRLTRLEIISPIEATGEVLIEGISSHFVGYDIPHDRLFFNGKSALAQLGVNIVGQDIFLGSGSAVVQVSLHAVSRVGQELLRHLVVGAYVGKVFAADERRRVRQNVYLARMFGRTDRLGRPLLKLQGEMDDLCIEETEGGVVAQLKLLPGRVEYEESIMGLLPTLIKALTTGKSLRDLIRLHQELHSTASRTAPMDGWEGDQQVVVVRTHDLHLRTMFARVVPDMLPHGFSCTSACIMQPDTQDVVRSYELLVSRAAVAENGVDGQADITAIPLELYTLEPYKEHVYFSDRDQLQVMLDKPEALFRAMATAPSESDLCSAVYVVKGAQLTSLTPDDWVVRNPIRREFPGISYPMQQAELVQQYIQQQPEYPFLKHIDMGHITSHGVMLSRHFPSPCLKGMLLNDNVRWCLKGIYFEYPSRSHGEFFSQEDRALMVDLAKFGIPVYRIDTQTHSILQFVHRAGKDSAMFVPLNKVREFMGATLFGVYGSNLLEGNFEAELRELLGGILAMRPEVQHPLLGPETPIAVLTGGGPGAMAVGNRVAKSLGILSCGNICDFRPKGGKTVVNEQFTNPFIEAKMSFRLEKLVERQAEFNLDFPIFLLGGIGTDFEYSLEEVRRKVGTTPPNPVILFGTREYWGAKITSRFQINDATGTIKGSTWLSNCFYVVQNAQHALKVYRRFFDGTLGIGATGPVYPEGFLVVDDNW